MDYQCKSRRLGVVLDGLDLVVRTFETEDEKNIDSVKLHGTEIGDWLNEGAYRRIFELVEKGWGND